MNDRLLQDYYENYTFTSERVMELLDVIDDCFRIGRAEVRASVTNGLTFERINQIEVWAKAILNDLDTIAIACDDEWTTAQEGENED